MGEYVGDGAREHEQALRHLEGDSFGIVLLNVVDGFVDFEIVVCGEERDGGVEGFVGEDFGWDLVGCAGGSRGSLGDYPLLFISLILYEVQWRMKIP